MWAEKLRTVEANRSGRQIAGAIVRDLIGRKFHEYQEAPEELGMSTSTLYRLMRGGRVGDIQLRKAERLLDLPMGLLTYVVEGDLAAIRELDMSQGLRSRIIRHLDADPAPGRERKTN